MKKTILNLGILPSILENLSPDQILKFGKIMLFDFSRIKNRLVVDFPDYSKTELDEMEVEVKKFLVLILLEGTSKHRMVVSEKIDALWHYFILSTKEYRNFCSDVFGYYLDHVPILPEEKFELTLDCNKTIQLYKTYFDQPPVHLWGENQQICWGDDERVSNPKKLVTV